MVGHNRCNLSKKAVRGSGGIGLLVKLSMYENFKVNVLDNNRYEGILWVKFEHISSPKIIFLICVCYLPPNISSRGDTSQEFFEKLGNQYLLYHNMGTVCICGDFKTL